MNKTLKISVASTFVLVALAILTTSASAAAPHAKRGDVMGATPDTFNAQWVSGVSEDGGIKGQSIALTDFAYYSFRNWWDQDLSSITKIQASFLAASTTVNSGGSPRFSLELDVNADGTFDTTTGDVVIYLDPTHCSVLATSGWMQADFTGAVTNCTIYDSTGASYTSDTDGTAWSKIVAAYPVAKIWFLYLIQDATTGTNYVDRIKLDSAFFTKQP
ncbi:MAG: hypothetical protein M3Q80_01920 [bacterium]|nr:hypothetical protein [bacterium]